VRHDRDPVAGRYASRVPRIHNHADSLVADSALRYARLALLELGAHRRNENFHNDQVTVRFRLRLVEHLDGCLVG
jgi:hypothetical protein